MGWTGLGLKQYLILASSWRDHQNKIYMTPKETKEVMPINLHRNIS